MGNLLTNGKIHHQIAKKIKGMKIQVKEVADRRDRYRVNDAVANLAVTTPVANLVSTTTVDPRLLALFKNQKELVGIDVAREEVTKKLTDGDGDVPKKQLKIISIVGFGGLGKTTLAKVVHEGLREKFALKAFVSVGQKPDVKKVLRDIFLELDKQGYRKSNASTLDEKHLIGELQELLENKRYFIVVDDIWDVEAWKIIECALKDSRCGSRIITTTRNLEVAQKTGEVYELKPLSPNNFENLFYTRLYGGKAKCPFDQRVEISKKILQKCGGVPLAIITIASLLDGKLREDWSKVYNSIGFGHRKNKYVDNTRKILLFSHYDLPYYLRTCLLYLSMYPEDYRIPKDNLIWKWVAEGFIKEEPEISQYELGERYFSELMNRSLIQPIEPKDLGLITYCCVHDLVLDMICLLSKEENFATVLHANDQNISRQSNARRLAIQKRVVEKGDSLAKMCMPQVRTFNATICDVRVMPPLSSFGALRVLAMEGCTFMRDGSYHLDHLGSLVQLRYLGLGIMTITEIPEEIGNLKFLQTLDLGCTRIEKWPQSIGLPSQLKCLNVNINFVEGIGWLNLLGNLTSLEELCLEGITWSVETAELGKLTELRKLRVMIYHTHFDDSRLKALVKSLGKLQKILVLDLDLDFVSVGSEGWEGYVPPRPLRELSLTTEYYELLPAWINPSLLPNLTQLSAVAEDVKARDMVILGSFRELVSLKLETTQDFHPDIFPVGGDGVGLFPRLRYLSIGSLLRFLPGAMPSLEFLVYDMLELRRLKYSMENFQFEFGSLSNLPSLQRVEGNFEAHDTDEEVVNEAGDALELAADQHPNCPSLEIVIHD